jgi:hypothetical protein
MHTLHANPQIMTVYLPWLLAALAGALELEGCHRLRRAMWGVHPILAGMGWLTLIGLGMAGATGLAYTLIYVGHALHVVPVGYWLPWLAYFTYMTVLAERERRAGRDARPDRIVNSEED